MRIADPGGVPLARFVWHPISFRSLVRQLGWRDPRFLLFLLAWVAFTLICIKSAQVADASTWINLPAPFLGPRAFVTIFPPVVLCQTALFVLGFEWAAIPAFVSMFVVCLDNGMPLGASTLVSLGQPLGLAMCALIYGAAPLRVDLRTWRSIGYFFAITTAACTAGATGAFVWSAAAQLDAARTFAVWEGWVVGSIGGIVLLVAPCLRMVMPSWLPLRERLFPVEPHRDSPFLLATTAIVTAGLVMAAFLTEASQLSTLRLTEALRNRVTPPVATAIREAVASWQVSAWSAIAMVVGMTVVGLGHAYWWAARWRGQREQLENAMRRAEAASTVKSQFLAMISHELRTPLNGILGTTELLSSTEMTEEQREYLAMAEESGYQLLGLVNNLLDFEKIEAGKLDLLRAPFNVRETVKQALWLLNPKASQSGLNVSVAIAEDVPEMVVGDVDRVHQILLNLIGNAIKFTSCGAIAIAVNLIEHNALPALRISVQDTGIGIGPEILPRLFQPFSQGDSSTTRRYGGTGLGLSICQRLAAAMGGSVSVESILGQGSTFSVTLPFQAQTLPPDNIASAPACRVALVSD